MSTATLKARLLAVHRLLHGMRRLRRRAARAARAAAAACAFVAALPGFFELAMATGASVFPECA